MNKKKWFLNGGRGSGRSIRLLCETYENKIAELEKENAELKAEIENDRDLLAIAYMQGAEKQKKKDEDQLTKAKELLRYYFDCFKNDNKYTLSDFEVVEDTEQFLNSEVEK